MVVVPIIGLRNGRCVPYIGAAHTVEHTRVVDPVVVARDVVQQGFRRLIVMDLDAEGGCGSNAQVVREILHAADIDVLIGGGLRSEREIERLLGDGAAQVVIGGRALEDWWWLEDMASKFSGEIIVAASVHDRRIATRDWTPLTSRLVLDVVEECNRLELAGLMITVIDRAGTALDADLPLMQDLAAVAELPVFWGGRTDLISDLRAFAERGTAACALDLSVNAAAVDLRAVFEEFGG